MSVPARSRRSVYLAVESISFDDCLELLSEEVGGAHTEFLEISGCRAMVIHQGSPPKPAKWCAELNAITDLNTDYRVNSAGAVLIVEVEDHVFAIGFGRGSRWLETDKLDARFGLRFAVRVLDPDDLSDVMKRTPGMGRTDITMIPTGASVWQLGVDRIAQIVRRLGGKAPLVGVEGRERLAPIEGGSALRLDVPNTDDTLIAELSDIASTLRDKPPVPQLAFVEHIVKVAESQIEDQLNARLEHLLAATDPNTVRDQLAIAAPEPVLDDLPRATTFKVKIGGATSKKHRPLALEHLLQRTHLQQNGKRVESLIKGRITLIDADEGCDLKSTDALRWLEAVVTLNERRFFLLDKTWYEIGAEYLATLRSELKELVAEMPGLDLPAWHEGQDERGYNEHVPYCRPRYVCLDRQGVRTPLHRRNGVEICDLLGPNDELIHVKRASSSEPLSHLFNQGLVSAQALVYDHHARAGFEALVRKRDAGRTIDPDFTPRAVVYAIQLRAHEVVTLQTLFPFAQVALRQAARGLRELNPRVSIHVVTIPKAAVG